MDPNDNHFDIAILGTGLTESILAAALSKASFRVAHIDDNPYYGADEASLTPEELLDWAKRHSSTDGAQDVPSTPYAKAQRGRFTAISWTGEPPPFSRQYSLSLAPSVVPSSGPLISSLVASGVARYGGYRLVERVGMYSSSSGPSSTSLPVRLVPNNKEDVFKNKDISLVDKRRLMRFLLFATSEFEGRPEIAGSERTPFLQYLQRRDGFGLKEDLAKAVTFALAYCTSPDDPSLPALIRIRQILKSSGRYGASPFILAHYGGAGEIVQGFCRTAAVGGAAYVLGRAVTRVDLNGPNGPGRTDTSGSNLEHSPAGPAVKGRYTVGLQGFEETITCDLVISAPDFVPPSLSSSARVILPSPDTTTESSSQQPYLARCVAIIDRPILFESASTQLGSSLPNDQAIDNVTADAEATDSAAEPSEEPAQPTLDTAILVFPPSSLPDGTGSTTASAHVLITGEGSLAAPKGKWLVYISLPYSPPSSEPFRPNEAETILRPYLSATLALAQRSPGSTPIEPTFAVFYLQRYGTSTPPSHPDPDAEDSEHAVLVTPPLPADLVHLSDAASVNAEAVYWEVVKMIKPRIPAGKASEEGSEVDRPSTPDSFWPPLESTEDDEDEPW